jgi:Zn-dependent protease with chaperone function
MSDEEAAIYVSDGLAALPVPVVEAVMAHEVAHEVLGHIGTRRALSLSITAGFTVLGLFAPGASLIDFIVNPVAVRAFSRRQELEADQKAVEILRAMGHPAPRRTLVEALRTVAAVVAPRPKEDPGGLLSWHPTSEERFAALEPLEPATTTSPVAVTRP